MTTSSLGAAGADVGLEETFGQWVAIVRRDTRHIEVSPTDVDLSVATDESGQLLFDGILYNADDLRRELGDLGRDARSDAELVFAAFRRHGSDVVYRLRGQWVLIARDRATGDVVCARDHYGHYACFYVEQNGTLLVSPSVEALVHHPGVSSEINRVALVDHLRHRWPVLEETYYEAVRRLPGGYRLTYRNGARDVSRYWRPNRDLDHSLTPEETQERFDELLQQGVARCMFAPSAIFLSGGLDSVSVAAFASENAASNGQPPPYALSLIFDDDVNEEDTQVAVARQLGFEQTIVPLLETVPRRRLLRAAMEMSAALPAPMLNFWSPAYRYLAIEGRRRSRAVILTGNGGDEWLEYPIVNGERMIKKGDLVGMYRAWRTLVRSRRITRRQLAKNIAWTYGASLILRESGSKAVQTVAPGALRARRRRRIASETGDWLVDDPALLTQILDRYEAAAPRLRESLDSPHTARDFEESFERARKVGLHTAHPLWDVDLTAFLERLPPESLIHGGRSKALVRYSLARRFPDLGFETQRKAAATSVFKSCMFEEAPDAWRELGGAKAIVALGIADKERIERRMEQLLRDGETWHNYWIWYVLTIEAWLRPRVC